jgi:hypothetical protein
MRTADGFDWHPWNAHFFERELCWRYGKQCLDHEVVLTICRRTVIQTDEQWYTHFRWQNQEKHKTWKAVAFERQIVSTVTSGDNIFDQAIKKHNTAKAVRHTKAVAFQRCIVRLLLCSMYVCSTDFCRAYWTRGRKGLEDAWMSVWKQIVRCL